MHLEISNFCIGDITIDSVDWITRGQLFKHDSVCVRPQEAKVWTLGNMFTALGKAMADMIEISFAGLKTCYKLAFEEHLAEHQWIHPIVFGFVSRANH